MLGLPESGLSRSIKQHNSDLNVLCDWVEASVVFEDEQVSKSDVVDRLIQDQVYEKQDFAAQIVDVVWSVISLRMKYLNSPLGIKMVKNRIIRSEEWESFPAYGFCLALACAPFYPTWAKGWGPASVRGELFEQLAQESFKSALRGWTVRRMGWSPENPKKLRDTIESIISDLNEVEGSELDLHIDEHANELGLDLLAYYSFDDKHASLPVILIQCASGDNWKSKRKTPDLDLWRTIVSFNSCPVRGFAIPFAYAEPSELRKHTRSINGVVIERTRLLAGRGKNTAKNM